MTKIILSISLIITIIIDINGQTIKQDKLLKGKVNQIEETEYYATDLFGSIKKDSILLYFRRKFDKKGNEIEFEDGDSIENRRLWIRDFDERDNIVSEVLIDKNSDRSDHKYQYEYKPNEISINHYHNGLLYEKIINKIELTGKLLEKKTYSSTGKLNTIIIYKYDIKGNEVQRNQFKNDGSLEFKNSYEYSQNNRLIKHSQINMFFYYKSVSVFDERGNVIEYFHYRIDKLFNEKLMNNYFFRYNENGLETEKSSLRFDIDPKVENTNYTKYDYDKMGNWIRKMYFIGFELRFYSERTITYYTE
jgi:hypothetical protein